MPRSKQEKQAETALLIFTRKIDSTESFLSEFSEPNRNDYQELLTITKHLTTLYAKAEQSIFQLDADSDTIEQFYTHASRYEGLLSNLKLAISDYKYLDPDYNGARHLSPAQSSITSQVNNQISAKLPEITLPTFNGNITEWPKFRDDFQSVIGHRSDVPDRHKLHYLTGCLIDNAKQVLQNLQITDYNFSVAWETLKARFDSPRVIVSQHLNSILDPPKLIPNSSSSLQNLIDFYRLHVNAIQATADQVNLSDLLLCAIITKGLPPDILRYWELSLKPNEFPTFESLMQHLQQQQRGLTVIEDPAIHDSTKKDKVRLETSTQKVSKCPKCSSEHPLYKCSEFIKMTVKERNDFARQNNRCVKCLTARTSGHSCNFSCNKCNKPHNRLLHYDSTNPNLTSQHIPTVSANLLSLKQTVLLPTAQVKAFNSQGAPTRLTALLDTGSGTNLITWAAIRQLGLHPQKSKNRILTIGHDPLSTTHVVQLEVFSYYRKGNWSQTLECIVVNDIPTNITQSFDINSWNLPHNLYLADYKFNKSKPLHLLLGADVFFSILSPGNRLMRNGFPTLQETKLGWIVAGNSPITANSVACNFTQVECDLSRDLKRFWETEEVTPNVSILSEEESTELHFTATHTRDHEGRYVVCLPFKDNAPQLGNSKAQAYRRLLSLEKRFETNTQLKHDYVEFMTQYKQLGHMCEAPATETNVAYYIPHHPVIKPSSTTTRLRVVFDASARTSTGVSLNDILMNGDKIQDDLFDIFLRFRINFIAIIADLEKMFRQVNISKTDWHHQHILWRESPSLPIKDYVLTTVTYGTKPATFLAVRALHQLITDEGARFPLGCEALKSSFYVDDFIFSCNNLDMALDTIPQLIALLATGKFKLRKWASNIKEILSIIPSELLASSNSKVFGAKDTQEVKTLGISWHPTSDKLNIVLPDSVHWKRTQFSKRSMLSVICSLFDPVGILAPCIIKCKVLFQKLWSYDIGWDDPLPKDIALEWQSIFNSLCHIVNITVPRCVISITALAYQLHGFADSSLTAYGAVIYVRSMSDSEPPIVRLFCAKTRVVPIRMRAKEDNSVLTIPRLELCAAVLLCKLMNRALLAIAGKLRIENVIYWTDSNIVLDWIKSPPLKGNAFARNRAQFINQATSNCTWKYVNTTLNPADILTRGLLPNQLSNTTFWWTGPSFLSCNAESWPITREINVPTQKVVLTCTTVFPSYLNVRICQHYSSFIKLIRVMAYVLRFIKLIKRSPLQGNLQTKPNVFLSALEQDDAELACVKVIQRDAFHSELLHLKAGHDIPNKSKLTDLNPFLHSDGCMRVGGRLEESDLPFQAKHQLILPNSHKFVTTLILHTHTFLSHATTQLVISHIRQRFWIPSIRRVVKSVLRTCITCFRHKPASTNQIMSSLPSVRVSPSPVFQSVGVDYTGHFFVKYGNPRSKVTTKVYLALFICMVTRAVHIEIVSALTSDAFIAALKRFTARRGFPTAIYSDNGTAFTGAHKKLELLYSLLNSDAFNEQISEFCSISKVQWNFITPRSPHCGGLWEANIKSLKHHLLRTLGSSIFTYEELLTISVQIEAILNSRPLLKLTDDPNDLSCLTPGHFLIGRALNTLPDPCAVAKSASRLSHWEDTQRKLHSVWLRWSQDYLHSLQQRSKWTTTSPNVKVGTPVLLIDENLPSLAWNLGLIIEVYPGRDNKVRIVKVKTSSGTFTRHVNKLCPLPVHSH